MTTTTITANPADTPESISVTAGGSAGARGVTVIVDWSKVESPMALKLTLDKIESSILRYGGTALPNS